MTIQINWNVYLQLVKKKKKSAIYPALVCSIACDTVRLFKAEWMRNAAVHWCQKGAQLICSLTHSLTRSLRTSLHHRLPPVQTLLLLSLFFFGRIIDYFSSGCSPPLCRRGEIERPPPPFHWDCVAESCGCDFLVWMRSAMRWSRGERLGLWCGSPVECERVNMEVPWGNRGLSLPEERVSLWVSRAESSFRANRLLVH